VCHKTKPIPSLSQDTASEPVNGFNCTNECSGHSLNFQPKGLDCCLGTVLSTAALEAKELPVGLQFSSLDAGNESFQFQEKKQ